MSRCAGCRAALPEPADQMREAYCQRCRTAATSRHTGYPRATTNRQSAGDAQSSRQAATASRVPLTAAAAGTGDLATTAAAAAGTTHAAARRTVAIAMQTSRENYVASHSSAAAAASMPWVNSEDRVPFGNITEAVLNSNNILRGDDIWNVEEKAGEANRDQTMDAPLDENTATHAAAAACAEGADEPTTTEQTAAPDVAISSTADFLQRGPMENLIFDNDVPVRDTVEYEPNIFNLLFEQERESMARSDYMDQQNDINGRMRAILFDWIIQVHENYVLPRLPPMRAETLWLSFNITDRYLSIKQCQRRHLQLVGITSLLIACKFEEIQPPEVEEFVHLCDGAYTVEDMINRECDILSTLAFKIVVPTSVNFMVHVQEINQSDGPSNELANYTMELSALRTDMLHYPPSHIAAASLLLSNMLFNQSPAWPVSMVLASTYDEIFLRPCVEELAQILKTASTLQLQALRRKYNKHRRHEVSMIDIQPHDTFPWVKINPSHLSSAPVAA